MNFEINTTLRSGPSRITGRCCHDKLALVTGASLLKNRCDFCQLRFWTSWNKRQCLVCKRYVHKTCVAKRNQSVKDENTMRTGIDTTTTRGEETARNDAAAGRDDSDDESPRLAATARAIAEAGASLVTAGQTLERGETTGARDESRETRLSRYIGAVRAVAAAGANLETAGRVLVRGGSRSSRCVGSARFVLEAGASLVATGRDMEHEEAMAARDEPSESRSSRYVDAARAIAATGANLVATGEAMGRDAATTAAACPSGAVANDRRHRDFTRPRATLPPRRDGPFTRQSTVGDGAPMTGFDGPSFCADPPLRTTPSSDPAVPGPLVSNAVRESPPTTSAVHTLSVGPSVLSNNRKRPYPSSDVVCVDPSVQNTVSEAPRVSVHNDERTNVIQPGIPHVSTEFWHGDQTRKPIPGPTTCNPKRIKTKRSFRQQRKEASPMMNNAPSQQNVPIQSWHGYETRGPPMWNTISEGRPTFNPPHMGPPMFNLLPMGPVGFNPPRMGPPMYNSPHMDPLVFNPSHIGPSRFNPPHMGPPVFNPPYTGPPMFNPHMGPSRFNIG